MVRLYFYVEGQTEQEYVARVLRPHLAGFGVQVMGAVLAASGRKHGHVSRGGGRRYQPMRKDLGNLLRQDAHADARFTTMFDLYALHDGFPGRDEAEKQRYIPRERVLTLETAFAADVGDHRFIPHIQFHEFETILLCDPLHFALVYEKSDAGIAALQDAVAAATSPELVNDGATTAPSKRIISQFPQYSGQKTTIGVELAECVGIATTRTLCAHFDRWLKMLESLGAPPAGDAQPGDPERLNGGNFMQGELRLETTILPGHRLEISAPELPEGVKVEVIVVFPENQQPRRISMVEFLESLPPGPRAFPTWEEYERHLQKEKNAWER